MNTMNRPLVFAGLAALDAPPEIAREIDYVTSTLCRSAAGRRQRIDPPVGLIR